MSGIAGIVELDGAPVDSHALGRMTAALRPRAPDAIHVWCDGSVGFGHALLRGTSNSPEVRQPRSLDGHVWVNADARIDARDELFSELAHAGLTIDDTIADADVVLHAYYAYGDRLLDRLLGDFAFALWDGRSRRLLCARDHFGVRPFFYAQTSRSLLFASDLESIVRHPQIRAQLDDEAIADFLLFGAFQDPDTTIYGNIRRLPAASMLTLADGRLRVSRYWEPPKGTEVRFADDAEYVERFTDVFEKSVRDRLAQSGVAVHLSGGMDCTSIAAAAVAATRSSPPPLPVIGFTTSCDGLVAGDRESQYAGMVASHLRIPLVVQTLDDYMLFDRHDQAALRTAEPVANPNMAASYDNSAAMIRSNLRVLLSGQGGDAMFAGSFGYHAGLLRAGRLGKLAVEAYRHLKSTGTMAGLGLRSALLGREAAPQWRPPFPDWIDPQFAKQTSLADRWLAGWRAIHSGVDAYRQLKMPWLSTQFEEHEALRVPVVVRYPFYDVRLVNFLLGVPNYVTRNKSVMRQSMRGRLPEPIRTRPKTYLDGDPIRLRFSRGKVCLPVASGLNFIDGRYVSRRRYLDAFDQYLAGHAAPSTWSSYHMITPIALNNWLVQHFS